MTHSLLRKVTTEVNDSLYALHGPHNYEPLGGGGIALVVWHHLVVVREQYNTK